MSDPNSPFLCRKELYDFCSDDGRFIPPQCQGNLGKYCREFWHIRPDWSQGLTELQIARLGFKFFCPNLFFFF